MDSFEVVELHFHGVMVIIKKMAIKWPTNLYGHFGPKCMLTHCTLKFYILIHFYEPWINSFQRHFPFHHPKMAKY